MKPVAFLYCQHSLGLGHFVRSLALAEALAERFDLVFLNGGPVPQGFGLPDTIRFEHLPPLRMGDDGSLSGEGDAAALLDVRRDRMLALAEALHPTLLIIELYPFGRKKFAVEIDPLIDVVRSQGGQIVCSVRDVLVTARVDQARHDDRAARTLNDRFDRVLVHADPRLFALSDSFRPATPIAIPVDHTGYVVRSGVTTSDCPPDGPTLVAAGGGAVGLALFQAAVAAQRRLHSERGWGMMLIAGPMLPEADWQVLLREAQNVKGLTLVRSAPSIAQLLAQAGRFVGQCGYNSALEVCQARLPALFVPFARGQESEQTARAGKLSGLGLAEWMAEAELSADTLADRLLRLQPPLGNATIDLDGARTSARILEEAMSCTA